MNIALVYHELNIGGGTYQLLSFAHELAKRNEVTIFAYSDNTNSHFSFLKKNINFRIINKKINKSTKISELFLPVFQTFHISKLILKEDFDIINAYDVFTQWPAVIVKFIKKTPVVWTCFDLWHIPGMEETKEKRIIFRFFNSTIRWWLDLFFTRNVNQIVVLDNNVRKKILKIYNCKAVVVRSGFDNNRFKHIKSQNLAKEELNLKNKFLFLCFSIFNPHRRFEDAIIAFSKLADTYKDTILLIIGSESFNHDYANFIKKLVVENNLENRIIVDTKFLSEDNLRTYLSASDVFVYPNERQTWGLAVIEAMSLGKPCIVSNACGVAEIIEQGKNGFIFQLKKINQLSNYMEVLYNKPTLRRQLGKEAMEYVKTNLSWEKHTEAMLTVFKNVTKYGKSI